MTAAQIKADNEIRTLWMRLERYPTAYVARPEGRLAALVLRMKGYATTREGEGLDAGLLLVTRTNKFLAELNGPPTGDAGGGGEAA